MEAYRKLVVVPGDRFGRGVVFQETRVGKFRAAQLRCDCGTVYISRLVALFARKEPTRSCGCLVRDIKRTHGLSHTHPLYSTWGGMMTRCYNPKYKQFKDWGGRGIAVCERWHDPRFFVEDIDRLIGPKPPGTTLDRLDVNGNYEPGNVRWATYREQAHNKRVPVRQ